MPTLSPAQITQCRSEGYTVAEDAITPALLGKPAQLQAWVEEGRDHSAVWGACLWVCSRELTSFRPR